MLIHREGFPKEGEIVYCKVTKINPHTVFVNIVEYNKGGLINISEISPGRIRNIRDYVTLGRFIVCKVLRVDEQKGHIDVSLRRVTEQQKREKIQEIKQEQRAEKIIEFIAEKLGMNKYKLFKDIWSKISNDYYYLYEYFQDVVEGKENLSKLKLNKKITEELRKTIEERIKPKEVEIQRVLKITSKDGEAIIYIKNALMKAEKNVDISYLGGSKYLLRKKGKDYKTAEQEMRTAINEIIKNLEKIAQVEEIEK